MAREILTPLSQMTLEPILRDIQRALESGAPYSALASAVTLPEICMRCEQRDIFSTKGENRSATVYTRFVETYLPNWTLGLTGNDLFILRCGLSHRGQTTQRESPLRYIFHPPDPSGNISHGNRSYCGGELHRLDIDLQTFCNDIADAVRRWFDANKDNEIVQRNLGDVLQVREDDFGLGVFVEGMTYLA